jgi:hypothetical protein
MDPVSIASKTAVTVLPFLFLIAKARLTYLKAKIGICSSRASVGKPE